MPGIFESLSRMFKGEPVFQQHDDIDADLRPTTYQPDQPANDQPHSDRTDGKIAPIVVAGRVKCDVDGERMTLVVEIRNTHNDRIYLDKILILGTKWELDRDMNAGEEREFTAYRGPRPRDTHQTRGEIHYRNTSGDYFSAIHYVEFQKLQDGMWTVSEIRFLPPVKDI